MRLQLDTIIHVSLCKVGLQYTLCKIILNTHYVKLDLVQMCGTL